MEPPTEGPDDPTTDHAGAWPQDWLERLAEGLGEPPISAQETDRLLRISRDVAHRVERRATPLAAFLAGVAVGSGVARGSGREAAFDAALDAVLVRLPDPSADESSPGR
jgi:Domain of unknown function (DUF6457)